MDITNKIYYMLQNQNYEISYNSINTIYVFIVIIEKIKRNRKE